MSPAVATPTGKAVRRRTALLEATLRVVARDGAAAASHRAVAAEAGVPLGSTTYYFGSREEMLLAALEHAAATEVERTRDRLAELRARRLGRAGWQREVAEWVVEQLGPDRAHVVVARRQLQLESLRHPQLAAAYGAWTAASVELAEAVLDAAGSADPAADAPVLVAAIDGLQLNALVLLDDRRRAALVRRTIRRAVDRLAADVA